MATGATGWDSCPFQGRLPILDCRCWRNWTECSSAGLGDRGSVLLMRDLGRVSVANKPLGWDRVRVVSQAEAPARHLSCCFALRVPLPSLVQCARARPCGGERLVVSRRPGVPALPLTSCGTTDTILNLSESQPIYLKNRGAIYNLLASLKNTIIVCTVNVPGWVPRPQDVGRTHSEIPGGSRCPPALMPPPQSVLQL